jgi:hypothetical protein
METVHIKVIEFMDPTRAGLDDALGRLGMSVLRSGVDPEVTVTLVRLTCAAHGISIAGLHENGFVYPVAHLRELKSIKLIHWTGGEWIKLTH